MYWFASATKPHLEEQLPLDQHLIKLMIVCCHCPRPISFLHRPSTWSNVDEVGMATPASFKSFMALIFEISLGMWYCSWLTISVGKSKSSGFHLAFLIIIDLVPQVREPVCGFCQLLSMPIPNKHSVAGKITTEGSGTCYEMGLS